MCLKKILVPLTVIALLTSASAAFAAEFVCTPSHVAVYPERIHVRCTTSYNDNGQAIWYFALPTTDANRTNRILTLMTTALVSGRNLRPIFTAGDTSGTSYGCAGGCRPITYIILE